MRSLLLRLRTLVLWLLALGVVAALAIVVLLQPAVLERVAPWAARQAGVELVVQGSGRAADGAFAIEQLRAQGGQWRLEIDRLSIRGLATHALLFDSRLEVAALSVGRVLLVLPPGSGEPATLPATLAVPLHYALPSIKIDELSVWRPDELLAAQGIAGGIDFDGSRHHVTLQAARLADTSLHGEASIAAQAPFALSVTLSAQRGPTEGSPIEANASLDGTLEHIGVTLNATGYAASLVGSAQVQPFAQPIIDRVNVRARGVDPNQVRSDLPHARIDGEVTGALAPDGRFNGEFSVRNQLPGPLDQARVPLHSLSARLQAGVSDARIDAIAADLGHGASLRGGARWGSEGSAFDVTVSAIDLSRLWSSARASSLAGAVQVQQSGAQVQARGQLAQQDVTLEFDLAGDAQRIELRSASLQWRGAHAEAHGSLGLAGERAFAAVLHLARIDPSAFGRFPAAQLNGELTLGGALEPRLLDARVQLDHSQFRGLPLTAQGELYWKGDQLHESHLQLALGAMHADAHGTFGYPDGRLLIQIDAPSLVPLGAGLSGALSARATVSGTLAEPQIEFTAQAHHAARQGLLSLGEGNLQLALTRGHVDLESTMSDLRAGAVALTHVAAHLVGDRGAHRLALEARAAQADVNLELHGGLLVDEHRGWLWQGMLDRLVDRGPLAVRLHEPVGFTLAEGQFALEPAQLDVAGGSVQIDAISLADTLIRTRGRFDRIQPVRLLQSGVSAVPLLTGDLQLAGDWDVQLGQTLRGTVHAHRTAGDVQVARAQGGEGGARRALGLSALQLDLDAAVGRMGGTLAARANGASLDVSAQMGVDTIDGRPAVRVSAPVEGTARFDLDFAPLARVLLPTGVRLRGRAEGHVVLTGSLDRPQLTGHVAGRDVSVQMLDQGVLLRNGTMDVVFDDRELHLGNARFEGETGQLEARGAINWQGAQPQGSIHLEALALSAINIPTLRLVTSGGIDIKLAAGEVTVAGRLRADEGELSLRPPRAGLSSDVVVRGTVDAQVAAADAKASAAHPVVRLDLDLGETFRVRGFGADAWIKGELRLASDREGQLTLNGRVNVAEGTVSAYGQELRIEQGTIGFSGPLENPSLNITAIRPNLPMRAGVQVTGLAAAPRIKLFSDPAMPESQILAWVVLGRSSDTLGQADWQFLAELAAATVTGDSDGTTMSKRIAQTFGLDEIGLRVNSNGAAGTTETVVSVGKRLSNKLVVSVEHSLGGIGTVLKVRYQLGRYWSIQTEAGYYNTIDLLYTITFNRWFARDAEEGAGGTGVAPAKGGLSP